MTDGASVEITVEVIDHEVVARQEVGLLVKKAKRKDGKDGPISTLALAEIAQKHYLTAERVNNMLHTIWQRN